MHINDLPQEVLSIIFSYLKARQRRNAAVVCKKWNIAMKCPAFFRTLTLHKCVYLDEPPLSLLQHSYHPFSTIKFDYIDEFSEDLVSLWKEVADSVTELVFVSCEGLTDETLEAMLECMTNIKRIKIIGIHGLSGNHLSVRFSSVTHFDISDTEMPQMYIADLVQSFPYLQELNLGSYTYDGWDAHEDFLRNVSQKATSTAFGDWNRDLCQLVPRVTLSYDTQIVHKTDVLLAELAAIRNLHIVSISLPTDNLSLSALQHFMNVKGETIQKLHITNAEHLDQQYFESINKNCNHMREIVLSYRSAFLASLYPIELLNGLQNLTHISIFKPTDEQFIFRFTHKKLNFPKMKSLSLNNLVIHPFNEQFELLLQSFPKLLHLHLRNCEIDQTSLQSIFKECVRLESMQLDSVVTNEDLITGEYKLMNLRNLEKLSLPCTLITDETLNKFEWKELFELDLSQQKLITSVGVRSLCENCPNLEVLILNGCDEVNDECIEIITRKLRNLRDIRLEGTACTADCLNFFTKNCQSIKNVSISYEPPVDSEAAEALLKRRILHILAIAVMDQITSDLLLVTDDLP